MARIRVRHTVDAPVAAVWDELARIENHVTWMADAASLEFDTGQRRGVGTRFSCVTRIGPFRTTDRMVITEWRRSRAIGVRHTGLVTGRGRFTIRRSVRAPASRTIITWREDLTFPWYLGGPVTAFAAAPVLRLIWHGNLRRLAGRCTDPGPGRRRRLGRLRRRDAGGGQISGGSR